MESTAADMTGRRQTASGVVQHLEMRNEQHGTFMVMNRLQKAGNCGLAIDFNVVSWEIFTHINNVETTGREGRRAEAPHWAAIPLSRDATKRCLKSVPHGRLSMFIGFCHAARVLEFVTRRWSGTIDIKLSLRGGTLAHPHRRG